MLRLSGSLIGKQVLSLRTGQPIATVEAPIINPKNLKIEGFHVVDRYDKKTHLVLLYQDIRELIKQGFVVNDHDVLADPGELVRLKKLLEIEFQLIGKPVQTVSKERIGKVNDFAVETETMFIQKIYVGRSLLKSLSTHSLSVDRTQIHEITNRKVVIQDLLQGTPANAGAVA